ncbi:MAG: hypothetical protein JW778_03995 [Candidatus Altiarchaeota archaeon]|nr:hypothetical protein [Candidatus Altiarchaeota archaeon]
MQKNIKSNFLFTEKKTYLEIESQPTRIGLSSYIQDYREIFKPNGLLNECLNQIQTKQISKKTLDQVIGAMSFYNVTALIYVNFLLGLHELELTERERTILFEVFKSGSISKGDLLAVIRRKHATRSESFVKIIKKLVRENYLVQGKGKRKFTGQRSGRTPKALSIDYFGVMEKLFPDRKRDITQRGRPKLSSGVVKIKSIDVTERINDLERYLKP